MKKLLLLTLILCFLSCTTSKSRVITTKKEAQRIGHTPKTPPATSLPETTSPETISSETTTATAIPEKVQDIINTALSYSGTPYKYQGTTRKGMDCSGLVYTAFTSNDVSLQRASHLMATQGKHIKRSQVRPGDLVFFITGKDKSRISHVGLVVEVSENDIRFIHATTSRGVLISSINEDYWKKTFAEARTIL